ncbi:MAG: 2-hydroxyacyl-CoA dehydratase family protein [Syntrophales bacterium]|nr:2-hydroxyacyl-CoA dehydratase family protein [Syntrophales bacterium]
MSNILEHMARVIRDASMVLLRTREKTGGKMIGIFHPVVPEELIYAAGLRPVRLFPYLDDPITMGDAHLQTYLCSNVRAVWDQVIKGKYPYLDGVIIPRSCEAVTFLYQTWKRHNPYPFIDYINMPWKRSENAIDFFAKELGRIKNDLEGFTGKEISEDSLRNAIKVYNRNRELMRKICELRQGESPVISGTEAFRVIMSGFVLDKEEHSKLMEALLAELSGRSRGPKENVRLLITGGCVIDSRLWEMIEESGACIVADDVNNGSRSVFNAVNETAEGPLKALARRYVTVPCSFNTANADRFTYLSEMIMEMNVNGVIFAINRNCEAEKFDYPNLAKKVKERFNVPVLHIETDYLTDMAPLRTRVEAFVEMLSAKEVEK